jgi:hypothetical protein
LHHDFIIIILFLLGKFFQTNIFAPVEYVTAESAERVGPLSPEGGILGLEFFFITPLGCFCVVNIEAN